MQVWPLGQYALLGSHGAPAGGCGEKHPPTSAIARPSCTRPLLLLGGVRRQLFRRGRLVRDPSGFLGLAVIADRVIELDERAVHRADRAAETGWPRQHVLTGD